MSFSALNEEIRPAVGEIGFYRPDPGNWRKNPSIVQEIAAGRVKLLEPLMNQEFEIETHEWMSVREMMTSTTALIDGATDVGHEGLPVELRSRIQVLCHAANMGKQYGLDIRVLQTTILKADKFLKSLPHAAHFHCNKGR